MSGCFGNSKEDRYFAAQLDKYLDEQDRQNRREERLHELVDASLEEGEEFYPFSVNNMAEAMSEMDKGSYLALCAFAQVANKKESAKELLAGAFLQYVTEYWRNVAEKHFDATMDD